ncbi:MAG TPA: chromate efflux transporter [Rhizomicrobium sp.]|nr:chromate efflux transporter [Rhizomicrobium sp.]
MGGTGKQHSGWEIFGIFLRLGLTSFGGPIAHLGYFRDEFVVRRQWVDEHAYAGLVGLCQFLPGPASSQVGFALGLSRRGLAGGLAAWLGFTLPSAVLLFAFATLSAAFTGAAADAAIHGLKIVAVAVVAQALWGMARSLTPDLQRIAIAAAAALTVSLLAGSFGQIAAIALGAAAGLILCRGIALPRRGSLSFTISRPVAMAALGAFFLILLAGPLLALLLRSHTLAVFNAFYRSGALVFGGGHVVLPLLSDALVRPGLISPASFLAGYGAAQAVPGPLFTVSAYLGTMLNGPPNGALGAAIALVAIFLPGMLIMTGTLPFWEGLRSRPGLQAAMRGINASVVGILATALYTPLWTSAIDGVRDMALAVAGFVLLTLAKLPPWLVVAGTVAASIALAQMR